MLQRLLFYKLEFVVYERNRDKRFSTQLYEFSGIKSLSVVEYHLSIQYKRDSIWLM